MRDQIAPDPFVVLDDAFCAQMGTVRHSVAVGSHHDFEAQRGRRANRRIHTAIGSPAHHENPLGAEFVEIRLELSLEERVVELLCDDAVAGLSVQRTQDLPTWRAGRQGGGFVGWARRPRVLNEDDTPAPAPHSFGEPIDAIHHTREVESSNNKPRFRNVQ